MHLSSSNFNFFYFLILTKETGGIATITQNQRSCADAQCAPCAAHCSLCGAELYDGEAFYAINGLTVCEDCLPEFAREEYRSFRVTGREWRML